MRTQVCSILAVLAVFATVSAQDVEGVKKETVTKTITTKGLTTEVKTVEETKESKSVLIVDKNQDSEDADYRSKSATGEDKIKQDSKVFVDEDNAAAIEALKKKEEAELEASRKAQLAKAEEERKALLEQFKKEQELELQRNRAKLEKRGKGVQKLNKKKKKKKNN